MPIKVTARAGDCLCGIAADHGFFNCEPLRALPENAAYLDRELNENEEVTVPDLAVEDHSRATDTKHTFKLKTSPPVHIRFVHGSPDLPYRDDTETKTLHISNFVTNLAGANGLKPFPTGYGYHDDGHADPDTFKVEVWDPKAGASVNVKLEALKPGYTANPDGTFRVASYTPFTDAGRKIDTLVCNVVSSTTKNTYRSKYMRLVVDEQDLAAPGFPNQLLLVTDCADGLGTGLPADNDTVEILDQMVRATYIVDRCTGSTKCRVSALVDIGGADRKRITLHFYAIRNAAGVDTMPTGVSADDMRKHLRRRTFKWYRRVFAQADMAPLLAGLHIVDPPEGNMIAISSGTGLPVAPGGATLDITLQTSAGSTVVPTIRFAGGETPVEAGNLIVAGLPAGFTGECFPCTLRSGTPNPAADVIITASNGQRVTLNPPPALSAAAGITIAIPRVNLMAVDNATNDGTLGGPSVEMRRILRMMPTTDDGMFCIVVGQFAGNGLRGQAFREFHAAAADIKPILPLRSSTIMAYQASSGFVLDNSDNLPFTSPHESAHVICDISHTVDGSDHSRTQLLGAGTSVANAVDATKRLADGSIPRHPTDGQYLAKMFQRNGTNPPPEVTVSLVQEILTHSAAKLRSW